MSRSICQLRAPTVTTTSCLAALSLLASILVTGCAFNGSSTETKPVSANPASSVLSGRVHGGQQPVSGATVQLWQVGTSGYGTGATALGSAATTLSDGSFSITGDYSCLNGAAGNNTLVYITATGGNPGLTAGTNNSALSMMVGLGYCGNLTQSTFISINEVTTIGSVYALAQFMGPTAGVGSYGASNQGLINAFATISNLVDTSAGVARATTPAGNGVVPQAELNTLANVLAPCVNSSGPTSGACTSLFGSVAPGTGGIPTTTLAAALQIALNPGYQPAQLLQLPTAAAPFQPTVTSINDWTVAIGYASGGSIPSGLAIDSVGKVWVANVGTGGTTSSVSLLSPLGVPALNSPFSSSSISGATAIAVDTNNNAWLANRDGNSSLELSASLSGSSYSINATSGPFTGLNAPSAVAVDQSNNIWLANKGGNSLTELYASNYNATPGSFTNIGLNAPRSIAFDELGNAWIANNSGASVTRLNPATNPATASSFTGGGVTNPVGVAIDGYSNVWVTDSGLGLVAKLNSSGTPVSTSAGFTGGGLSSSLSDEVDGSGSLWVADASGNALSGLSSTGSALSPTTGFQGGFLSGPVSMAIDASGDVWVANGSPVTQGSLTFNVTEFVGLASPAIMPLSLAVHGGQLGQRPGTPAPVANAGGPYTGVIGTAVSFNGSQSSAPSGQTLTYAWSFGDGSTGTGASPTHIYATAGSFTASLTVTTTNGAMATATAAVTISVVPPSISGFSPASGPVGTVITVSGANLVAQSGSVTQVTLSQQGGGTILAPISTISAGSLSFVIPAGAATGDIAVSVGPNNVTTSTALVVTTSSSYTLAVTPGTGTLLQGQSTSLAVTISSTNSFPGLAALSVSGLPNGVTATFQPVSIAVGQTGLLTLTAPASQAVGTATLTLAAAAMIDGQAVIQTATASLNVKAGGTTFLGRTVVDDTVQEPIAGVTVSFTGMDNKGNVTGCSGSTVSDGGGNFVLSNLSTACIGPQLISYNGLTATSPAGTYAGVNLSYTLVSGQVTASPVLVHLPRIDNAETVQVQQNSSTDQIFYFHSIPGVKVTVYAGTTLSLDDGSQPNPFPLVALSIPLDRLPEQMPTTGMLMPFIVAFQPANAVASQPVAVNFPNSLGIAAGTNVTFVTLDPTHGYMVPYGTGTVSSDGTEFVADADPNHPGHGYGLVHFDWHGPASNATNPTNPSPDGGGNGGCPGNGGSSPDSSAGSGGGGPAPNACVVGGPVDVASGIVTYTSNDIGIGGQRGGLSMTRVYRTLTTNPGPFGMGTGHQYEYVLNTQAFILTFLSYAGAANNMTLITPDGNQFSFAQTPNGSFVNATIPALRGAVLTFSGTAPLINCSIHWVNGTVYNFTSYTSGTAYLTSIVDLNGNVTTITRNASAASQITSVTDAVGRSLNLVYDSSNRITQITDPIGRKVAYSYNSVGTLATFTDQASGVTKYSYDGSNNLASITDPRGVVTEQNTYNESFDGRITQQVEADGGIYKFSYTLQNPTVPTSPVLQTVVTDPLGHATTYRFNMQGFLVSATDPSGQTRVLTRDPSHFNLVSDYTGNGSCPVCGNPATGDIHYTFDGLGNALSVTDSLGDTTSFGYDTRFNRVNSVTDPLGNKTSIQYDASANPLSVTDANGHTTSTAYDQFGEPVQITDASGAKTALAYDAFGNVSSVTNAVGNSTYFSYDGVARMTQVQDALGRKGGTAYDPLDRVTSVTDPLGNKTQLAYDAVGGLLTLTDPKGNATNFTYDSRERLTTRTNALGKSQSYAYDLDSDLTQFTDRRGQVSKYAFDVMNRLTQATYQDSTVAYNYDPAGRLLGVMDSMDGSFGYKYDSAGRLLQQSQPTGVIQYTHDALGRVATEQVVGQPATTYTYDPAGNMLSAAMPNAGVTYTYDARNLPLTLARTNGVTSAFSFDSIGELLSLTHSKGASVLTSFAYQYDKVGQRSQVTSPSLQALTTQSSTSTVDANNQLLTNTGTTYTYDLNGNRLTETTSSGTRTYAWDSRNRLSSVTDSTGTTTLKYDYTRNLLGVSGASAAAQTFVVDAATNVASFTPGSGSPLSILHGMGLDSHWATVTAGGAATFSIGDALNSTAALTDSNGTSSSPLAYEPYGQVNGTVATNTFPFAYTGRVPILGNVQYFRNRYYDAGAGRFLSEDPIDFTGGLNLYEYADNNSIDFEDPLGLKVYNLLDPTKNGGLNQQSYQNTLSTPDSPNNITIIAHGGPQGLFSLPTGGTGYTPDQVTNIINKSGLPAGTPITLDACEAGKGFYSLAQQVANQTNAPVTASTCNVGITGPGSYSGCFQTYTSENPFTKFLDRLLYHLTP